jgi:hypothetical protein
VLITLHYLSFHYCGSHTTTNFFEICCDNALISTRRSSTWPRSLQVSRGGGDSAYIFYFLLKSHVSCPSHHSFPVRATRISRATACRVPGAHRAISNGKAPYNAFLRTANTEDRTTFEKLQAVYLSDIYYTASSFCKNMLE